MFFAQKIYYNNKPLVYTNAAAQYLKKYPVSIGYLFLKGSNTDNLSLAQNHLKDAGSSGVLIEDNDIQAFQELLQESFTPITAAGGVVSSPGNKTLMIYRHGKWDLPKGKLEDGEDIQECARREVMEETGLPKNIEVGQEICRTYHVYSYKSTQVLKTTYWFRMTVNKEYLLSPQEEEDILKAVWIEEKDLPGCVLQTWNTVKEVLELAGKKTEG